MASAPNTATQGKVVLVLLSAAAGLIVGAVLASVVCLVFLRPPGRRPAAEPAPAPPAGPTSHTRLPTEEVLDYLEGKPLPLPGGPAGAGGKAGAPPLIQRRGVKQVTWESTTSSDLSKVQSHHYALLYDAGDAHYLAEVVIDVRQVGGSRVYVGFQATDVRKADKIVDTGPK
jgi:hypothetical protein